MKIRVLEKKALVRDVSETTYHDETFHSRAKLPKNRWTELLVAMKEKYELENWVELGCGAGVDVVTALDVGLNAFGVDGEEGVRKIVLFPPERYFAADITKPLKIEDIDGIGCRETAEHIPFEFSLELVRNVVRNCRVCYWAAAPPSAPAHGHINCRFPEFWISLFEEHGWGMDRELTKLVTEQAPLRDDREHGYVLFGPQRPGLGAR